MESPPPPTPLCVVSSSFSLVEQCLCSSAQEASLAEVMTLIGRQHRGHQEKAARGRYCESLQVITQPVQHVPVIRVSGEPNFAITLVGNVLSHVYLRLFLCYHQMSSLQGWKLTFFGTGQSGR